MLLYTTYLRVGLSKFYEALGFGVKLCLFPLTNPLETDTFLTPAKEVSSKLGESQSFVRALFSETFSNLCSKEFGEAD